MKEKAANLVLASTAYAKVPAFYPRVITQCGVRRCNLRQRRKSVKSTALVDLDSCNFTRKSERYHNNPWRF